MPSEGGILGVEPEEERGEVKVGTEVTEERVFPQIRLWEG